ncbi:Apoptosis-inducing factor 1 [Batrachochytrium dendrobatidis]|nr:Apoptosis-inducing factor 1 [Batrachochytrium dendrobatidis]KAK5666418.1 Apoptosis-inducing factor 1 [Batrachochytrium dendrobatidis]
MEYQVAHINDLTDGQMKEVRVGEIGKALLSKVDGKFYATSHLCPHYKAPLVKGTLSSDGRVMCPFHGACFRVQTGDIEDAPSIDSLVSFSVTVRNDHVYISTTTEEVKAGRRGPVVVHHKSSAKKAVIVGGGAGGLLAAETLREEGFEGKVIILSRESYLPIDRPKLSKALKIDASKIALRNAEHFKSMDIDIRLSTTVKSVDTRGKTVTLDSGVSITYDHLVLATGGDPRVLPIVGKELGNVFVIRTVDDANAIDAGLSAVNSAEGKPNVVIVGSSFIGMESASILAKHAVVTVIGMEKVPFERVLGADVGKALKRLNDINGIKFELEALVDRYEPSAKNPKQVGFVVLKSGKKIPADVVVLGAGVFPQTTYLKESGIVLDKDGGISVNSGMQVPDVENVYAVGDIARYPYHITGENVRIEHWNVAQNQGRVAALNIMAKESNKSELTHMKQIPYFWTVQFGKSVRYAGYATSFDNVIIQGSTECDESGGGLSFAAFYMRKGQLISVCSVAKDPVVSHVSELLRLGKAPTEKQLKDGLDVLSIKLNSDEKFSVPEKTATAIATPTTSPLNIFLMIAAVFALALAAGIPIVDHITKNGGNL